MPVIVQVHHPIAGRVCLQTRNTCTFRTRAIDVPRATLMVMIVALVVFTGSAIAQIPAFPGAEGAGMFSVGGRGGKVIEVTNLNDNGAGSLRAAVTTTGARTIVFRVSGTISLLSPLEIRRDSVTIAGQTAPGDGICLKNYTFKVSANHVIIRFMRFRLGDSTRYADDAFDGYGSLKRFIMIDHCSASWAIDETASFYDLRDFTMQWCYITESLYHSYHPKGNHGYGGMWGGWRTSFHHNLLAHHSSRNPRFNGSRYTLMPDSEVVDFRNNVIYNWGFNSAYGGEAGHQNMVANYFKYGPATNSGVRSRIVQPTDSLSFGYPGKGYGKWYVEDNYVFGDSAATADNWTYGVNVLVAPSKDTIRSFQPFPVVPITQQTAEEAYNSVLMLGGASLHRDIIDSRITEEVRTGTAQYGGMYKGPHTGIIDTQDSVGGWPLLQSLPAPPDSDHDGMPDQWEIDHGLNPYDASDGQLVSTSGYTNLETYLNSLVESQTPSGVAVTGPGLPDRISLQRAYPNPFNPLTEIEYSIPTKQHVTLTIYSLLGARVATLVNGEMPAGIWKTSFDGSHNSSGIYLAVLSAGGVTTSIKLVLMK